jgi:hypothetical protein
MITTTDRHDPTYRVWFGMVVMEMMIVWNGLDTAIFGRIDGRSGPLDEEM